MTHELWVDREVNGYGHGSEGRGSGWPGLAQMVLVRVTREFLEGPHAATQEDHYYLTSLASDADLGRPEALLKLARDHWEIENGLHHKKDRSMGEDAQRARRGAGMMARLRSIAVGLLPYLEGRHTPEKQVHVSTNPHPALRLLKRKRFPKIKK